MNELSERDHSELLMLYQVTIEDIERAKQWGWTVAYTTMAAQGAVLGLFVVYKPAIAILWVKLVFAALTIGLGVVGINHIRHAQSSL